MPLFIDQVNVRFHRRVQRLKEQIPVLGQKSSHFGAGFRQLASATFEVSIFEMIEAHSGVDQGLQKITVRFAITLPEILQDIMRLEVSPLIELPDSQFQSLIHSVRV